MIAKASSEGVASIFYYGEKGSVYVERRTLEQKEADKQNATDGQNRKCAYSFDFHSHYCAHRGFVCIDQTVCADNRTAEDEALQAFMEAWRQEEKRKQDRADTIVARTLVALVDVVIEIGILCCIWDPGGERDGKVRGRRGDRGGIGGRGRPRRS